MWYFPLSSHCLWFYFIYFLLQNPLKLAHRIVQGDFKDIDDRYSNNIKSVAHDLLDKVSQYYYK